VDRDFWGTFRPANYGFKLSAAEGRPGNAYNGWAWTEQCPGGGARACRELNAADFVEIRFRQDFPWSLALCFQDMGGGLGWGLAFGRLPAKICLRREAGHGALQRARNETAVAVCLVSRRAPSSKKWLKMGTGHPRGNPRVYCFHRDGALVGMFRGVFAKLERGAGSGHGAGVQAYRPLPSTAGRRDDDFLSPTCSRWWGKKRQRLRRRETDILD